MPVRRPMIVSWVPCGSSCRSAAMPSSATWVRVGTAFNTISRARPSIRSRVLRGSTTRSTNCRYSSSSSGEGTGVPPSRAGAPSRDSRGWAAWAGRVAGIACGIVGSAGLSGCWAADSGSRSAVGSPPRNSGMGRSSRGSTPVARSGSTGGSPRNSGTGCGSRGVSAGCTHGAANVGYTSSGRLGGGASREGWAGRACGWRARAVAATTATTPLAQNMGCRARVGGRSVAAVIGMRRSCRCEPLGAARMPSPSG